MTPEERNRYRGILVRAVVALRTGLGASESTEELDNEIDRLEGRHCEYGETDGCDCTCGVTHP